MTVFANTTPTPGTGGMPYATNSPVSSNEADVFNQSGGAFYDPVPVPSEHEAVFAVVQVNILGGPVSSTVYVILQTDLGDNVWIDVSWVRTTITSGTAVFALTGGAQGCQTVAQTRAANTDPGSNGTNKLPLGGRIRFVAKATEVGANSSSSVSSGSLPGRATVTIKYQFLNVWGGSS